MYEGFLFTHRFFYLLVENFKMKPAVILSVLLTSFQFCQGSGLKDFQDAPLQIVRPDVEHKRLVLVKENLQAIKKINGPVATVAVVGKFHSGKSFLMNQLMGKAHGFGIGPTVRPETMGIWMWGQPLQLKLKTKETVSIIFLDTEGFAANNISETYDAKIFAVATLISSHLIYNSVKIIDQGDIDYLELLSRRTQLFALRSQLSRAKWSNEFVHDLLSFPPLLWVVQDFTQRTLDNETSTQWLHRLMETHTRESEQYRISLLDIFKSLECHTMFIPAMKKRTLEDLSGVKEEDLTEDYKKDRDDLIKKLQQELVPKIKNNKPITAPELAGLFQVLVDAANDGSLADVPSRWDSFVDRIKQTATEDCLKFYESEMGIFLQTNDGGPVNALKLEEWHTQVMSGTIMLMKQLVQGIAAVNDDSFLKLNKSVNSLHEKRKDINEKKIRLFCTNLHEKHLLHTEETLKGLKLPIVTRLLKEQLDRIITAQIASFDKAIGDLIPEKEKDNYRNILQAELVHYCDSLELNNHKALTDLFEAAVSSASEIFVTAVNGNVSHPRTQTEMNSAEEQALDVAFMAFKEECKFFNEEKQYGLYEALLKDVLQQHSKKAQSENEASVELLTVQTVNKLAKQFEDHTSQAYLNLPVNDTDLELRLDEELRKAEKIFEKKLRIVQDYSTFAAYENSLLDLRVKIQEISKKRKDENVAAFVREVQRPLSNAKKIIFLSAKGYGTEFSFKKFVTEVCMIQLDEGKPKFWQPELKENIINKFISSDSEIKEHLNSLRGIWSTVWGFLQRVLYAFGLYRFVT